MTDRGVTVLPAWRLDAMDVSGPIWLLDPDVARWAWEPPAAPPSSIGPQSAKGCEAVVADMEETVTFRFIGAPKSVIAYPCAEVIESERAVAVVPVARRLTTSPFMTAEGHVREVIVHLARPLAGRVLVALDGTPLTVLGVEAHQQ